MSKAKVQGRPAARKVDESLKAARAAVQDHVILRWVRQIRAALPDDPHRARELALELERLLEGAELDVQTNAS